MCRHRYKNNFNQTETAVRSEYNHDNTRGSIASHYQSMRKNNYAVIAHHPWHTRWPYHWDLTLYPAYLARYSRHWRCRFSAHCIHRIWTNRHSKRFCGQCASLILAQKRSSRKRSSSTHAAYCITLASLSSCRRARSELQPLYPARFGYSCCPAPAARYAEDFRYHLPHYCWAEHAYTPVGAPA